MQSFCVVANKKRPLSFVNRFRAHQTETHIAMNRRYKHVVLVTEEDRWSNNAVETNICGNDESVFGGMRTVSWYPDGKNIFYYQERCMIAEFARMLVVPPRRNTGPSNSGCELLNSRNLYTHLGVYKCKDGVIRDVEVSSDRAWGFVDYTEHHELDEDDNPVDGESLYLGYSHTDMFSTDGTIIHRFKHFGFREWSPDCKVLAVISADGPIEFKLFTVSDFAHKSTEQLVADARVFCIDTVRGLPRDEVQSMLGELKQLCWSPCGRKILCVFVRQFAVFYLDTCDCAYLPCGEVRGASNEASFDTCNIYWAPDGTAVALSGYTGTVIVKVGSSSADKSTVLQRMIRRTGVRLVCNALAAWAPDMSMLALFSPYKSLCLVDYPSLVTHLIRTPSIYLREAWQDQMMWSPDSRRLAFGRLQLDVGPRSKTNIKYSLSSIPKELRYITWPRAAYTTPTPEGRVLFAGDYNYRNDQRTFGHVCPRQWDSRRHHLFPREFRAAVIRFWCVCERGCSDPVCDSPAPTAKRAKTGLEMRASCVPRFPVELRCLVASYLWNAFVLEYRIRNT